MRQCECGARRSRRAGGERRHIGVPGLDDELRQVAQEWAEESATAQGLPARVEDLEVLRNIVELLELRGSDPPDRAQA